MVFVKNVKYCEAECGERLDNFAKELIEYKNETQYDVIGNFGGVLIEVKKETTVDDIIRYYHSHIK